jgi:hypothetical protein
LTSFTVIPTALALAVIVGAEDVLVTGFMPWNVVMISMSSCAGPIARVQVHIEKRCQECTSNKGILQLLCAPRATTGCTDDAIAPRSLVWMVPGYSCARSHKSYWLLRSRFPNLASHRGVSSLSWWWPGGEWTCQVSSPLEPANRYKRREVIQILDPCSHQRQHDIFSRILSGCRLKISANQPPRTLS